MAIIVLEKKNKTAGTMWQSEKGCYVGYRIDVRIHGKRYRNKTFPTRREAEGFIAELKIEEKIEKTGLSDDELIELFIGVREKTVNFTDFKEIVKRFQR